MKIPVKVYRGRGEYVAMQEVDGTTPYRRKYLEKVTLVSRIIAHVNEHPGLTAWSIAKQLTEEPNRTAGVVSATLNNLAKRGRLLRTKGLRGSWTYWPGTGVP